MKVDTNECGCYSSISDIVTTIKNTASDNKDGSHIVKNMQQSIVLESSNMSKIKRIENEIITIFNNNDITRHEFLNIINDLNKFNEKATLHFSQVHVNSSSWQISVSDFSDDYKSHITQIPTMITQRTE